LPENLTGRLKNWKKAHFKRVAQQTKIKISALNTQVSSPDGVQ